jgi:outer membrane immunogenic protein
MAADMPPYVPPEPVAIPFSWTGFYLGAHGGWNWADTDPDGGLDIGSTEGFVVGGQLGYNWQWDSILFGIEGDGSFVDSEEEFPGADVEQNFLASIRGRVGFALDRFLIYGTGGAAFTGLDMDFALGGDDEATYFGWVAGGGIEYAITDNVSFGVEYLHYDFGEEVFTDGPGTDFDIGLTNDVVRGRLNIKFDSLFN